VFLLFFSNHAVVWHSAFDTGGKFAAAAAVVITGGKFEVVNKNLRKDVTPGVNNTGGKFAAGIIDPVANLSLVSLTPLVHLDFQIFEQKCPQFYNQGPGGR
jgi:hypothetical protein